MPFLCFRHFGNSNHSAHQSSMSNVSLSFLVLCSICRVTKVASKETPHQQGIPTAVVLATHAQTRLLLRVGTSRDRWRLLQTGEIPVKCLSSRGNQTSAAESETLKVFHKKSFSRRLLHQGNSALYKVQTKRNCDAEVTYGLKRPKREFWEASPEDARASRW